VPEDASDFGADAASLRVRALSAAGRGTEAVDAAVRLIDSSPKDPRGPLLLLEARLVGASRAGADRALQEYRPSSRSPRELVTAADTLRRAGFGSMGVALLARAVEAHPQDASLLFSLGGLHGQLGAARKADAIMEKVLVLDPGDARAQNYLGYSLAERGKDLPRAEALIRKALASEPSSAAYIDSLGWVLYKQGRLEEAGVALERAADMMAGDATVREHLGDLYRKRGAVDRAIGEWKAAQALKPEDPARLRRKILDASREQR
jgi:Flp pilus assembly protein TadD